MILCTLSSSTDTSRAVFVCVCVVNTLARWVPAVIVAADDKDAPISRIGMVDAPDEHAKTQLVRTAIRATIRNLHLYQQCISAANAVLQ